MKRTLVLALGGLLPAGLVLGLSSGTDTAEAIIIDLEEITIAQVIETNPACDCVMTHEVRFEPDGSWSTVVVAGEGDTYPIGYAREYDAEAGVVREILPNVRDLTHVDTEAMMSEIDGYAAENGIEAALEYADQLAEALGGPPEAEMQEFPAPNGAVIPLPIFDRNFIDEQLRAASITETEQGSIWEADTPTGDYLVEVDADGRPTSMVDVWADGTTVTYEVTYLAG